ncbi:marR family protein [Bordetella holmesii 44057]|nr:marR family protein [Bordetella holmesii ATCC 51541]AIT25449.1 marR family protein [Bordetella holmesii 44057]
MAVCSRLFRMNIVAARNADRAFRAHGMHQGEFDVLATLFRAGLPYSMSPQQLIGALLLSSGAMTNRLDRLESAGLIARSPNPEDRRSVLVSLTQQGQRALRHVLEAYLDEMEQTLAPLNASERRQLAGLLKRLLAPHDQHAPGGVEF